MSERERAAVAASGFVSVNGLRLHYLDYGGAGEKPLVCIHGLTQNAHVFDVLAPHLTHRYRVIAIDVRGRGDSQWGPAGDYTFPVYVSDLAGLLDALGIERVALVGTSMGGVISMLFAGGYPRRADKVVLNDIGPEIDPRGLERIRAYNSNPPASFGNLDEVVAYYRTIMPRMASLDRKAALEFVKWTVKPGSDGQLVFKMDPAIRNPRPTAMRPLDLWVPYARILAPILIVRGGESDILARDTVTRMCTVSNAARSVEVPGVGHAPSLTEPAALAALKEFLDL